ncbi:hypothetical protein MBRA1_001265 [Malassezia brasiliensis]|uniref:Rab-GAP TBC domain-containing protein n=1 Tax=Malassezia brasiliensis TaxID=1821822 RepID=A0AAF0DSK9_9BASI|nr:hypothetical protein MBRA1_001265 [Malassezia brasiliensis]
MEDKAAVAAPSPAFCSVYWRRRLCIEHDQVPVDPLQNSSKDVWQEQQTAQRNMDQIELDVQRLDETDEPVRRALVQLLYVWSCVNADIGYRQGMHEIAAFLWQVRTTDGHEVHQALEAGDTYPPALSRERVRAGFPEVLLFDGVTRLFDVSEVEADTFYLTSSILYRLQPYFTAGRSASPAMLKAILHRVDPVMAQHFAAEQLDWQPILMRWQRLLFLYEFTHNETLRLWDSWLAQDPGLELMQYVSAVIILRLRPALIGSDYAAMMQLLMHRLDERITTERLVEQADELRASPTSEMAAAIALPRGTSPPPDPGLVVRARERLLEMTGSGAQRLAQELAHLTPFQRKAPETPVWSPKTEDRLRTDEGDKELQRRRAMLSLEKT